MNRIARLALVLALLWAAPAGAMDTLAWGDLFADAFRSSFRDAREITAAVDPADPGLERGLAARIHLFISDVTVNAMRYDRLTVELRDVEFLVSSGSALIRSIGSGSIDGSISAENLSASVLESYPRLTNGTLTLEEDQISILGVYKRDALVPLRATMRFWGDYCVSDGEARLVLPWGSSDNALVSRMDVAAAIAKAAPVITFRGLVVSPPVISVQIAQNVLWVKASSAPQVQAQAESQQASPDAQDPQGDSQAVLEAL